VGLFLLIGVSITIGYLSMIFDDSVFSTRGRRGKRKKISRCKNIRTG